MNLTQLFANGTITPEMAILFAVPVLGAVAILLIFAFTDDKQSVYKRRIKQIKEGRRAKPVDVKHINAKRSTAESDIAFIDRLIKSALPRREQLRRRLDRAGVRISLARYLSICLVIGVFAIGALLLFLSALPKFAAIALGCATGLALPHLVIGYLGRRRTNKFIDNFPDAIDLMVRGLKSGLPITESIKTAGEEIPNPVGEELTAITDGVAMGQKLEDLLWELSEKLELQEFKFFTVSLAIQSETGGNLAETLQNLSNVLRGRRQLKLKIRAMSSEAKASAYIIGSLPFVVAFFIYLLNPEYISKLVEDPRGHVMLVFGAFSFMIGGGIMYKLVKFDI